ncbi:MAG: HEAT repeat domain-containing protein [Planctomycetota bacterium]|jgi:hypothetical protein
MRRFVLVNLLFLGLTACGSSSSTVPYAEPNELMGEEIDRRITQIPYQHREELFNNLLWLSQAGEQALPSLIAGLQHDEPKVRSNCAWVIGKIGDRRTIPDLQKVSQDKNEQVRLEVARSLVTLGDMGQAPTLIAGLDSDKVQVRYLCHEALKLSTGRDFSFDHLSEDVDSRHQAVWRWRNWWSEQSGDSWFAKQYADENGLSETGELVGTPEPPAAPDGETKVPETEKKDPEGESKDPTKQESSPAEGEKKSKNS